MRRVGSLLLCLALLAALGGAQAAAQTKTQPQRVVRVALPGFENNITPFTITFGALPDTNDLVHLVYDSLFWSQASADPEPWLAESATPSPDFLQWTVRLHNGVTWQDGQPLTADDVKFSFDYYLKAPAQSGRYAHHVSDTPPFDHAEVLDPQTVRLFYKAPAPTFKILPGADLPIIPRHVWEKVTDAKKATQDLPVGSGPYKVTEIVPDQRYRLEANPSYFKGKPTVDVIEMPIVKDPSAAFAALSTGGVDLVARDVPPELMDSYAHTSGITLVKGTRFESTQLYFNAQKAPLSDPRLRKAISLAIDNRALVDTVLLGHGRPGSDSFIHPDSPWALPGATHEHDPARAAKMLDDAGYVARDPDGVRKAPNGTRLDFSVLVSSFAPQDIRAVQLVSRQVAPVGVKLTAEALDPATLTQRRQAPAGGAPTYDAYMGGLETHAHTDPDGLYYFFHSPGPKGFGSAITGYSNPEFDAVVEKATTADVAARKPLLHQAERILAQDAPVVVFWYPDGDYAFRPAAYDGWVSDPGGGIFTVRSFLSQYAHKTAAQGGGGGSGTRTVLLAVLAGLVVVGIVAGLVVRRRRAVGDDE